MALQSPNFLGANIPTNDYSGVRDIFKNFYTGYEQAQTPSRLAREKLRDELMNNILGVQSKYAEPTAQMTLKKGETELATKMLENALLEKYGAKEKESGLALNQAHMDLFGAQSKEHGLNAEKQQIIMNYLKQALGGQRGQGISESAASEGQMQQGQPPQDFVNNYLPNAIAAHSLGVPQHHPTITPTGEIVTFDPLSGKPTVQQGLRTPEEVTKAQELSKHNVKAIEQNYETYSAAVAQKPNLQGVLKQIENPKFEQAVGPWKNVAAKYLAPDDVKELQASFSTLGKNIVTESAKAFSRLTNQEMTWLQGVLPSPSDTFSAIKGKVKTLEMLREATEQKTIMKDQLMRKYDMDPVTADQLADQAVDYDAIKREIKPTVSLKNEQGEILDIPKHNKSLIEKAKAKGYTEGDF